VLAKQVILCLPIAGIELQRRRGGEGTAESTVESRRTSERLSLPLTYINAQRMGGTMTHFLEVGSLREGIQEIIENGLWLRRLLAMTPDERAALEQARAKQGDLTTYGQSVGDALSAVINQAEELATFLDRFESAPVIYTGDGTTAEVMVMLERMMANYKQE